MDANRSSPAKPPQKLRIAFARANLHDRTPAIPRALEVGDDLFGEVGIFCWNRSGEDLPSVESDGRTTIHRFEPTAPPRSLSILLVTLRYQFWVLVHLLRFRPHVVQTLELEATLPARLACFLTGARLIYDMRDPVAWCYRFPPPIRALVYGLDWLMIGLSSALVIPTEWMLPYLGRWARRKRRPVAVIHNTCHDVEGASEPGFAAESEADRDYERPIRIAFLGYLVSTRGADVLLDLVRSRAGRVELIVAGQCRSPLLRDALDSTPGVTMLGKLSPEAALRTIRDADLVALMYDPAIPVNRIAAPNKFFEAMMAGTPVVVCDDMKLADWVHDHELGFVVRYGNRDDLRNVVTRLADAETRRQLRQRCRSYYLRNCRLSDELVRYRRFYEYVLLPAA